MIACTLLAFHQIHQNYHAGADLGRVGGGRPLSGNRPPADPKDLGRVGSGRLLSGIRPPADPKDLGRVGGGRPLSGI